MNTTASNPRISPIIVLMLGIVAVSTGSILVRKALVYAPPLTIAAYRMSIASLLLLPVVLRHHRQEILALGRRERLFALLSGVFLAFHFAFWITSLSHTTVASSVVLVSTTPIWVALLAPFTLKEHIQRSTLIGMLITLAGAVIVGLSDSCAWGQAGLQCPPLAIFLEGKAILGDILALLGAITVACYMLIGRTLRQRFSLVVYIFLVYGVAAMVLLCLTLVGGSPLTGFPIPAYLYFLALAVVPQLFGHSTFNWALRYVPTAFVSLALLGEPVGTTILAYLILSEKPTLFKLFGAGLILVGLVIASQNQNNKG